MVPVTEDVFGTATNPFNKQTEQIRRFTLANDMQMSVQIITLGATVTSIKIPDAAGNVDDVVLGYDDVAGYQSKQNPYFGATVGRVCNRVANGRFPLEGLTVEVSRNWNDKHQLHGGFVGFDKAHWEVEHVHVDGVTMSHRSPDGHEGYPGEVLARVRYTLTEDNCLHVKMTADTSATTAVNMTNHSYFNLAGHNKHSVYEHSIMIKADRITETDADSIPTGKFMAVAGTAYDLRAATNLGAALTRLEPASGFDDNYCVEQQGTITTIAKASHAASGRWLEIASNQPGVQFYTSNFLPDPTKEDGPPVIIGKGGANYIKHGAFCLETQKYPDAVNHPNFPSIILNPGEKYEHIVIYKFGVCRGGGCAAPSKNQP